MLMDKTAESGVNSQIIKQHFTFNYEVNVLYLNLWKKVSCVLLFFVTGMALDLQLSKLQIKSQGAYHLPKNAKRSQH